jgi:hypothetical protein
LVFSQQTTAQVCVLASVLGATAAAVFVTAHFSLQSSGQGKGQGSGQGTGHSIRHVCAHASLDLTILQDAGLPAATTAVAMNKSATSAIPVAMKVRFFRMLFLLLIHVSIVVI